MIYPDRHYIRQELMRKKADTFSVVDVVRSDNGRMKYVNPINHIPLSCLQAKKWFPILSLLYSTGGSLFHPPVSPLSSEVDEESNHR